jgi:hypothetical protein
LLVSFLKLLVVPNGKAERTGGHGMHLVRPRSLLSATFSFLLIFATHLPAAPCGPRYIPRNGRCIAVTKATLPEIKALMIAQSIAQYPGRCPCPYFRDRAGRLCGRRSAYSRPGGYAPLCYPEDITDRQAIAYRKALLEDR